MLLCTSSCWVASNSFETPGTGACQAPLSLGISRQEYWRRRCHFLLQEIFLTQGSNLHFLHWQANSLPMSHLKGEKKILKEKCLIPWRFYSWRFYRIVFVQWLSCVWLFATPWTVAHQAPLSSTISRSLPKFMTIELVMPSNHFILCSPLLHLLSVFPSIRVFYNRVPNFKFSFEISHQDVK